VRLHFERLIPIVLFILANLGGCSPLGGEASWLAGKSNQELRAIWVQCDAAKTREQADEMLDRVVRGNFNTILYCVGSGAVNYNSALLDTFYVTPEYDTLAYVVEQGHARGLKVQAWWSPGLIMTYGSLRDKHPEWDIASVEGIPDDFHWANFSLPEVRQFVGDIVMEIATNYDVEGIALDYIRYPAPPPYSPVDCAEFFSPDDVPATVQAVYQRLKAARPDVQLTGYGMGSQASAANTLQNWADWLAGEYVDQVIVSAYLGPDQNDRLQRDIDEWKTMPHHEQIAPSLSVVADFESKVSKTPDQLITQIEICRAGGFKNFAIFDEQTITNELLDVLAAGPFSP
jgi:uncharacterized lipoprotein YddW (UPF0748 family)